MDRDELTIRYYRDLIHRGYPTEVARAAARRLTAFWIIQARKGGMKYADMGKRMGVSTERARQKYLKAERFMANEPAHTPFEAYAAGRDS